MTDNDRLPTDEGREAFHTGKRLDENPYPENTWQHEEWYFGWECEEQCNDGLYDWKNDCFFDDEKSFLGGRKKKEMRSIDSAVNDQKVVQKVSEIKWAFLARTSLRAINGLVTLSFAGLFGYFIYQQYLSLPRINLYQLTNAGVCFGIVATFIMIGQIIKHGFKGNPYWFKQLAIAGGVVAVIFGMPGLADGVLATIKGMLSQYI